MRQLQQCRGHHRRRRIVPRHPVTHYDFGRWEGDASGSANPLTLAMSANRSVTARFRSPYQRWKFTYFTEAEIYQSQITWPEEDPDKDGINNLMEYVLGACHILGHPDFTADLTAITWIDHKEPEQRRVAIKCERHHLVSKLLVGNYPNYKQVIPAHANQMAVIPHDRKPGLIAWLRSLGKDQCSVRLDWHKRGQLTLSHRDANGHSATMQVPVEIHGNPPVIAFNARYLADALEIGSTLCLSDELSPGICRHPTGRFAVIMPMRLDVAGSPDVEAAEPREPQAHPAQAAA